MCVQVVVAGAGILTGDERRRKKDDLFQKRDGSGSSNDQKNNRQKNKSFFCHIWGIPCERTAETDRRRRLAETHIISLVPKPG